MTKRIRGRPKGSNGPAAILTPAQIRAVLQCARQSGRYRDRAELALILSLEFGLTAGQLVALTAGDLMNRSGCIREALSQRPAGLLVSELRQSLADYCERHLSPEVPDVPLFASQRGGALTRSSLGALLTSIYKRAGIRDGSSRSGRKTLKVISSRCPPPPASRRPK
jgi:integrase/recombinase XerD